MTKVRRLDLSGSKITDAALESFRGMTELEILSLYRTQVSDLGLTKLSGLRRLRQLDLRYSRVTSSGVERLAANVPNARVEFQDSSNRPSKPQADAAAVRGKGEDAIADWLRSIGGKVTVRNGHVFGRSIFVGADERSRVGTPCRVAAASRISIFRDRNQRYRRRRGASLACWVHRGNSRPQLYQALRRGSGETGSARQAAQSCSFRIADREFRPRCHHGHCPRNSKVSIWTTARFEMKAGRLWPAHLRKSAGSR